MFTSGMAKKLREMVEQQQNQWADKYVGVADPNEIWFGGLDLDSKHDYARDYMSPEQMSGWGNMNETQRREVLRNSVHAAMNDDDDAFGEKLVKKGVPLAVAALGAYALAPAVAGAFGGGAGAGMAGKGALAGILPGESGGIPAVLGGLGGGGGTMGAVMNGVKLAGALGALGGKGGAAPPGPQRDTGTPTVLSPATFSRTRNPVAPDYFTYGKSGGEHRFFNTNDGPATPPASGAPGAGALSAYVPNEVMNRNRLRGMLPMPSVMADGGRTPVTGTGGRTDDIEALLSEGEYVMDAETVSLLGDGSNEAGAARLDELRANLRKHKGQALAKGEFTPPAKQPEAYMAKGGRAKITPVPEPIEVRNAQLDAARRMVAAYRRKHQESLRQSPGYDPYNKPREGKAKGGRVDVAGAKSRLDAITALKAKHPIKKAEGGAVTEMEGLADKLEAALRLGDSLQIDSAMEPVMKLAKGGLVKDDIVNQILEKYRPKHPTSPEDFQKVVEHLRAMKPDSEVLRSYDAAQKPRIYARDSDLPLAQRRNK